VAVVHVAVFALKAHLIAAGRAKIILRRYHRLKFDYPYSERLTQIPVFAAATNVLALCVAFLALRRHMIPAIRR
jgi:hypothetical protein